MALDPWAARRAVSESQYRADPDRFGGGESDFAHWVLQQRPPSAGARLLELGCGPGRDLCFYATRGFHTTGVDHAEPAADGARGRIHLLPEPARSRARVVHGEAHAVLATLPAGTFDVVTAHLVYGTFADAELRSVVAGVAQALRPGGVHAFALRTTKDPRCGQGKRVGDATFLGGPHAVPYRYYTPDTAKGMHSDRFDPMGSEPRPAAHLLYLAGRRRAEGGAPSAATL